MAGVAYFAASGLDALNHLAQVYGFFAQIHPLADKSFT
jgi:hypothetical protein